MQFLLYLMKIVVEFTRGNYHGKYDKYCSLNKNQESRCWSEDAAAKPGKATLHYRIGIRFQCCPIVQE
jgi:hypothetical protein